MSFDDDDLQDEDVWLKLEQQLVSWKQGQLPITFHPLAQCLTNRTLNILPSLIVVGGK